MHFIEARGLVKKYHKVKALDEVSFEIEEGTVFGILGPNGAGKSTTILMLSTLLKPDEGEILYTGSSIIKNPGILRPVLGLVPQDIALYQNLSAKENLEFWGRIYGVKEPLLTSRISEAARLVGLSDRLRDKVETLSGGMKRRLNIAAALIHKPRVIIMDEPTVGIDAQSRKYIISAIKQLNTEGSSIIYTSHYIDEVESLCHKITILDRGRVIASGNKEDLRKRSGVREKITIELDSNDGNKHQIIPEVLAAFPDSEVTQDDGLVEVVTDEVSAKLSKILNVFDRNNVKVAQVNIDKPNLEKIYFSLIENKAEAAD